MQTQPQTVRRLKGYDTEEEWLKRIAKWLCFGLFVDDKLVAVLYFEPRGGDEYRAHVDASRDVMGLKSAVKTAAYAVGFKLFNVYQAKGVDCLVPYWQKINMSICRGCGMKRTGRLVDVSGTKAVEFMITRDDFIREHQWRAGANADTGEMPVVVKSEQQV